MPEKAVDLLTNRAISAASLGANKYLESHNLQVSPDVLSECLVVAVKSSLRDALRETKQALDCGMADVAAATFTAAMIQAGISAAKSAVNHNN